MPTSGTSPLQVGFTDVSSGSPTSWAWDFGDGGTSAQRNPTHTYSTAGSYTVTLTVTNAVGSDTKTRVEYISVLAPPPPVADFSASPTSGTTPLTVTFTDLSSGGPTSRAWDFGDGGTSSLQNPTHTYTSAGTYTVALTVANTSGSDTKTRVGYITATQPPPDFSLSASPTSTTVVRGHSAVYTIAVVPSNDFTGSVDLSVSGLPAGASATFDPGPVTVPPTGFSTLRVATASTTKQGTYSLTVTGVAGVIRHSISVGLQVKRR